VANKVYPIARKAFLDADVDMLVDDIRLILVDLADYTYSDAHDFLDDVPAGARVAVSGALANKSTTGGVFDCDDPTLTAVTGDVLEAVIVYRHTGASDAARRLLAYVDTKPDANPITFTPNGSDVVVNVPAGGLFEI
jgi:hypothetical protein